MQLFLPWFQRLLLVLGIGVALGISLFVWIMWLSPQARAGKHNYDNSYRLRKGMSQRKALAIMGPPDDTQRNSFRPQKISYSYSPLPLASDLVSFCVGPDSLVTNINHGDN
jgi:hypothetical protein